MLPLPALYFLAGFAKFFLFSVVKYRRKVVAENLYHAFPNKSSEELKQLAEDYYKHLTQNIAEVIKAFSISSKELKQHVLIKETYGFKHLRNHSSHFFILTSHQGNWEWAGLRVGLEKPFGLQVVYKQIHSKAMDEVVQRLRGRLTNLPVQMKNVAREVISTRSKDTGTCFLADQKPITGREGFWTEFLNRKAPFYDGAERLAVKLKLPVYYGFIKKIAKGKYQIEFELLWDGSSEVQEHEITLAYISALERDIKSQPETYLWSHTRWRRSMTAGAKVIERSGELRVTSYE